MLKYVLGLVILAAFHVPVSADVTPPPWTWNTYSGTTMWQVTVTESDSGCGGAVYSNQYTVPIQYRPGTAVMGDVGHGSAGGTFASGNILHIPSRSVADPPGSSDLSEYDVFFTTDCSAFAAKYSWVYTGPDGDCSGTTLLSGTNSNGCPAPAVVSLIPTPAPASNSLAADIAAAQRDLNTLTDLQYTQSINDITPRFANLFATDDGMSSDGRRNRITELNRQTENELQAILLQDPTNYDANMGMAELKKSQRTINEYIQYLNAALNSREVAENKVNDLQKNIAQQNNLATWPTPSNSGAVSEADNEIPPLIKNVLDHDFSNVYSDSKKAVKAYLYATLCERRCDYLTESANQVASTGGGGTP
jgi:hypothetical protein